MLILGKVQLFNPPYFARNALNFDDPQKTGNYTTPEEIDEISELQQVTATGRGNAKRCRFYRVELLNRGKYRTRGEVPPDRRKQGKDGRSGKGGKVEEQEQIRWKIFIKQKRSK